MKFVLICCVGLCIILKQGISVKAYCRDGNKECRSWSERGECMKNPSYMLKNCRYSCAVCSCRNIKSSKDCNNWKSLNYCVNKRYKLFMARNCKATCYGCGKLPTKKPIVTKCADKESYKKCSDWKRQRLCEKYINRYANRFYNFMRDKCAKTCRFCITVVPTTKKTKTTKKATTTTTTTTTTTKRPNVQISTKNCGLDKKNDISAFLVGGTAARPYRWLWQIGLYDFVGFVCGGSLIARQYVVTAAHCVRWRDAVELTVRAGDHIREKKEGKEQEVKVASVKFHEDYDGGTIDNDIAVLKLEKPLTLNNEVGTVCLPSQGEATPSSASECYITGWGKLEAGGDPSNILQEAKMTIIPSSICGKRNVDKLGKSKITKNMICTGTDNEKVSGCQGDSGGPLVCKNKNNKWVLQGAVSWGSRTCDAKLRYTVFAKVSNYINWIQKNLN